MAAPKAAPSIRAAARCGRSAGNRRRRLPRPRRAASSRPAGSMTEGSPMSEPAVSEAPLLEVRDLKMYFDVSKPLVTRLVNRMPRYVLKAVDGLSFAIRRGETFSLVGESGCGKSTVARTVAGLNSATGGEILIEGKNLAGLKRKSSLSDIARRMQMVFQSPYASLDPRWRVRDVIAEPILWPCREQGGGARAGRRTAHPGRPVAARRGEIPA